MDYSTTLALGSTCRPLDPTPPPRLRSGQAFARACRLSGEKKWGRARSGGDLAPLPFQKSWKTALPRHPQKAILGAVFY